MTDAPPLQTFDYRAGVALDYWCSVAQPAALVVYAHGGSFVSGTRQDRLARHFATLVPGMGLAFASIDYRKGGDPWRDVAKGDRPGIEAAVAQSAAIYPEIAARLFGPLLYRATQDFGAAVDWLRHDSAGPALGDLPLIVAGLSAGGMAALGHAYGLDGASQGAAAVLALGVASVPPQPWRIMPGDACRSALLVARGDAIMPRAAVHRLDADLQARGCPVEVEMIPYGQHNRPVRELLADANGLWSDWFPRQVSSAIHQSRRP
jgi:alpha/beta superfamily hydrolase